MVSFSFTMGISSSLNQFSTVFFSGIIIISIIFLTSLLFPQSIVLIGGKLMGHWTSFCLKKILFVTIEDKGKENIITKNNVFIAD